MRLFSLFTILILLFSGCENSKKETTHICPHSNMPLPKSNINTSTIDDDNYFDDIGCLILWSKENNIDLKKVKIKVYTSDTHKYIDARKVWYKLGDKTPMNYGFGAYEKKVEKAVDFNTFLVMMYRGENLTNPAIRKKYIAE